MKPTWQLMSTRTINLDGEQLLMLEGRPGTPMRVIHRGDWLTADDEPPELRHGRQSSRLEWALRLLARLRWRAPLRSPRLSLPHTAH